MKKKQLKQGYSEIYRRLTSIRSVTERLWNEEEQSGWFEAVVGIVSFGYFSNDVAPSRLLGYGYL
jgi:hypothetical protein